MATQNSINRTTPQLTIDPSAASDSFIQFAINTVDKFRIGSDQSDSSSFKVSSGSSLGTNDFLSLTTGGIRTLPLQPAFLTTILGNINNVTGDGTAYDIAWDSEVFDRNADLSGSTFTAPVDGIYRFTCGVFLGGLTASHTSGVLEIVTNLGTYGSMIINFATVRNVSNQYANNVTVTVNMIAGNTAKARLTISGGTKVVDLIATPVFNYFCGYLTS